MVKIAAISGYKPYELGIFKQDHPAVTYIKKAIKEQLLALLEDGLQWVIISGQLGTELWAAEVVYELREQEYDYLQLAVITPFLEQENSWSEQNKEWYESILLEADFIDSVSRKPYEKPWQFRLKNQFFVQKSDVLILFYDAEKEGSPKYLYDTAIRYQEQQDYEIRLIQFDDLQFLVEQDQWE
ncbi:DUF1273 domain-containing protein [Niallia sp. Krafla_26]|uniref:DUF1273 domain-containing protein n=1 Tax=Niallia sp. Krafla_26 TaxID=3064703 RepID=UPI003D164D4D